MKILRVETGYLDPASETDQNYIDYRIYERFPNWLRKVEQFLRLDGYLAFRASQIARDYDIIWARSEKVGIPLCLMGPKRPLVINVHHIKSPLKALFIKLSGISRKWAGVGYYSEAQRDFLISYFRVSCDKLFFSEIPHFLHVDPSESTFEGPMISLGVSKRDYSTLLKALAMLEDYPAELYISSKFGDILSERLDVQIPEWVNLREFVPQQEIAKIYQKARFAILPLMDTTQTSAGLNLILEAGAFGKTVIATRNSGTEKLIQDGETGILVPPYDVHAMKDAIQRLWDNPELAIKMGTAARKHLVENYNPEKINHRINEIFLKIHRESQNN